MSLHPDEQNHEWPACISIQAPGPQEARQWGDHLAKRYSNKNTNEIFLRSEVAPVGEAESTHKFAPQIPYGYEATDEEIGW